MSGTWLPVLLVLAAGLVSGLAAARRLRSESSESSEAADRALRIADLERRRDSLYRQIRNSEDGPDRERLEFSAAHVLQQLDELRGGTPEDNTPERDEHPDKAAAADSGLSGQASAEPVATAPARQGRPMLAAFLSGAALVALVGVLIYWALSDAKPQPQQGGQPAGMTLPGGEHPTVDLPPDVQAEIDVLRNRLAADPSDLLTHKQLALALLAAESFMEAYEMAEQILAAFPDDPDGLYIQGMVRLTMGQDDQALPLLDRVLDQYPNHIMALAGRGMIFFRRNDREAALMIWERALEAAGGSHPDIEQLLAMARGAGGTPSAAPASSTPAAPTAAAPAPQAVAPDSYGIEIVLAPGVQVSPSSTLFVFLRAEAQGPPAAVKRIQGPRFPARLSLGPSDTMLGRPLPESGTISVRLDADGSASTRDDSDLVFEVEAEVGSNVRVVLGQ